MFLVQDLATRCVRIVAIGSLLSLLAWCSTPPPHGAEAVIVIHGLGRTSASMAILATRLEQAGFRVLPFGYPSTSEPIEMLVDRLRAEVERCCPAEAATVHFVTHSMGACSRGATSRSRPSHIRGASSC